MGRIRTIKPEFFKHLRLYKSELETKLPLRVAFAGLWTVCDREGRFEWIPEQLKIDVLPYDQIDFSRVLDALSTRGFVVKYRVNDREYGHIPSWKDHQFINNRESSSKLPEPSLNQQLDASLTRDERDNDATSTDVVKERKGREGKERVENALVIPEWVPIVEWKDYEEMRKRIRKPMTDKARELAIKELEKLRSSGHDPKSVLNQSILNSYQGLFAPKQNTNTATTPSVPKVESLYDRIRRKDEQGKSANL